MLRMEHDAQQNAGDLHFEVGDHKREAKTLSFYPIQCEIRVWATCIHSVFTRFREIVIAVDLTVTYIAMGSPTSWEPQHGKSWRFDSGAA